MYKSACCHYPDQIQYGCRPPSSKNRYDVITPPRVVRFWRNLVGQCRMIRLWRKWGKNRNRKYNFKMAAVRFPKPEVALSQPWIEISYFIEIWHASRF